MPPAPSIRGRAAAAALFFAAAGAAAFLAFRNPAPPRPDIVLIVWDTCRADRVSAHGYGLPTSPALEALAAEGTRFPRCYTPSPWTPPSHASLFTGLLPSRHGLREKFGDRIHPGLEPMATTLGRAGYETVAVPANPLLGVTGLLDGFETVLPVTAGAEKDSGEVVASRVEGWLRARHARGGARRPLFLFVNLMDSHLPLAPPREDIVAVHGEAAAAAVPAGGSDISPFGAIDHTLGLKSVEADRIRALSVFYDSGVRGDDRATARIFEALKREGIHEGALMAITGDHGECLGEHGELDHRMSIREAALHVPLVVRWPGRFAAGRVEEAQVRLQDLYRTFLDAAGCAVPPGAGTDSVSLAGDAIAPRDCIAQLQSIATIFPQLKARFPELPPKAVERMGTAFTVFREAARGPATRKLVIAGGEAPERLELYDLAADPAEDRDLLAPGGDPAAAAEAARLRAKAAEAVR